ncbi:Peptidoglycan/LPS O-acetylase OafA/YrhL, contains acyltransferase and SGNH-hydrolase domains [Bradyrhizobium sp. Rc2d]|uniref:acyltransferase family protein n=1 Tax=Bradyrhizobium sp. Rc2d TaxID=1855321 RepID=UPI00088A4C12|nr:acyltransferase [Bradyrhizobium sp. Rc2d]SDI50422.1 Peptidoglycan/LPS O-acetylase OafA/YrhL, contains acyltransferase and SGNH-hydrolase domains [Bradyrhizobium sp. Rc2d]
MHASLIDDTHAPLRNPELAPLSDIRISEIDGLRGVAVLLVLMWHFVGAVISPTLGAAAKAMGAILIFGRTGVDLFFVLSGFLIIGILVDRRNCNNYFIVFFARRALRILPPYSLLLIAFWALSALVSDNYYFGTQIPWWSYATFTQNWYIIKLNSWGPAASSVTWSVAIEEQFYLVFPIIVYLTPTRFIIPLLLSIGFCSIVARASCFMLLPQNPYAPYVATCLRLDGLCAGGLLAVIRRDAKVWQKLSALRLMILKATVFFIALVPIFLVALQRSPAATMFFWGHTYLTILYSLVLTAVLQTPGARITGALRSKPLRQLGSISYTTYLFHPLFIGLAFIAAGKREELGSFSDAALLAAAMLATLLLSAASYRFVERKLVAFGHKLSYSPSRCSVVTRVVPAPKAR